MKQTHLFKTLLLLLAIVEVSNAWAAPGKYEIWAGSSSADKDLKKTTVSIR